MKLLLVSLLALGSLWGAATLVASQAERAEWNAWVSHCRAQPAAYECRAYYGQQEE